MSDKINQTIADLKMRGLRAASWYQTKLYAAELNVAQNPTHENLVKLDEARNQYYYPYKEL